MIIYLLVGLIAFVLLLSWLQSRKYLKIIQELTDKLMSRNYSDYLVGKELKKDDKAEVKTSERTDLKEMLIEKAKAEGKKLEQVEKEFNKKIKEVII